MEQQFPYRHFRPSQPVPSAREKVLAQWRGWNWSSEEKARWPAGKSASQIMPRVLKGLGLERRQAETEILKVWANQIDPNITAHAQPTGLCKGTLFVSVYSNVWLDEIVRYRRREILERLQNSFGRDLVTKISFRCG
jgi:hypothetical protein